MAKIPGRVFPVDPSIPADAPKFRFEVVVTVTCGGASTDQLYIIETDDRISSLDAANQAIEGVRREGSQDNRNSPPPPAGDPANCTYTARVVSAGRRSDVPAF